MRLLRLSLAGAMLAVLPPLAASAQEQESMRHRTVFDVTFGGLSVGTATFDIGFDGKQYSLGASGKTTGVAELFAPGSGKAQSAGRIEAERIVADRHSVVYVEPKKTSTLEMTFADGAVASLTLNPDKRKKKKGKKWVQISPDQLKSVIDPASTLVVPVALEKANDPKAVCDRVFNVYDGDTRFDIKLSYKSTKPVDTKGYKGYAYVCQLRYIPVSGHKTGQRNIEYMRDNTGMEIWLAPMQKTNVYSPIRVEVPTWIGKVVASPRFFGPSPQ